jgi:fermentation-respiration switch protein FrsA (DUF1100 family)
MVSVRKIFRRMFLIIPIAAAVFYLIVLVVMYLMQPGMVYFPSKTLESNPQTVGLPYDDVFLTTADGVRIHAWFVPANPGSATILVCHGNGGNISHRLETIRQFHDLGLSVFLFDYHGYGKSDGRPGEEATYMDAETCWQYLTRTKNIAPGSVIIYGQSLGGAVAAWLAARHKPGALILESAFTSIPDIAAHHYPWLPVRLLARFSYATKTYLEKVDSPVLVIHSPDDEIVPFSHGKALYEAAQEPKEFLEISGSHNDGFLISGSTYLDGLRDFLQKYVR